MRFLTWPFRRPAEPLSAARTILWWEIRRLVYNLVVGICGMASVVVFILGMDRSGTLAPGEDAIEPLGLIVGVILAGVAANVCYTLGWVVELVARAAVPEATGRLGVILFAVGLGLSCAVIAMPGVVGIAMWLL